MKRRDYAPNLFAPTCSECGRRLVRTSERYYACPDGHGGLVEAADRQAERVRAEDAAFQRRLDLAGW
jgi:hypothetical protein